MIDLEKLNTILVTGGTGFLGQHLVKMLTERTQAKIKILSRKPNNLPKFFNYENRKNIEVMYGKDITNYTDILPQFAGVDLVFNLVGYISFSKKKKDMLFKVNVGGTKNVLAAVLHHRIQRLVHVSSTATVSYDNEPPYIVDERVKFNWKRDHKRYYQSSKAKGEEEVLKSVKKKGLNAVVANPSTIFGAGDVLYTFPLIKGISEGKLPVSLPGSTNVVDVRDVARGLVILAQKGVSGERYILGGTNLRITDLNKIIAEASDAKVSNFVIPTWLEAPIKNIFLFLELISPWPLKLTSDHVHFGFRHRYYNNSKMRALGWEPEFSFRQAIIDAVAWYREKGLLQ